jgi:hypothetical protein
MQTIERYPSENPDLAARPLHLEDRASALLIFTAAVIAVAVPDGSENYVP